MDETWLWALAALLMALCPVIYNLFFHPLRGFPGPRMAAATSWWRVYKEVYKQETLAYLLFDLHEKYGAIVRIAPNELHFANPSAFHDIYCGKNRWDKDGALYNTPSARSASFVFLKYKDAKERREVLQPMFSKRAIQNVESLVWRNANNLVSGIVKSNTQKRSIDLLYAFRSFTLDTIMGFTFGDCVNALAAPAFADPLITSMDSSLRAIPILKNFPLLRKFVHSIPPSVVMNILPNAETLAPRIYRVRALIEEQLRVVLQNPQKLDEAPHQTIFHRMLDATAHRSKTVPNYDELQDEGLILIFAGASTVADVLLMGHWNLLNQPELLAKLKSELLSVWPDIQTPPTQKELETLPLLTATIKESLRYIPSGISLTRIVPPTGAVVSGQQIPGGAQVGMSILHVHLSEQAFENPHTFNPYRWMGKDAKELERFLVPFSRGPRMCFGVNLAMCELYIVFATMIRRFDMALDKTTAEDMVWRECITAYYPRRHLHAWCRPAVH